jgi:3'-5' exoribonuclease
MPAAAPLDVPGLTPGDRVQHELLVRERAEKKTSAGDPFVILKLGNRSGAIDTAPIWSDKLEWAAGADPGRVVQVIGDVALYGRNGTAKRQLAVTAPLRVMPAEHFRADEFLPRVDEDVARLWEKLDRARRSVRSAPLRAVLDCVFGDDVFREQFERAPGSTKGHHAKIGGLLQHTVEVANIAVTSARAVRRANLDLVTAGALLHDVGKVEAYEVGPGGFSATPCGLLVGHVVLGVLHVERRLQTLGEPPCTEGQLLELRHMILSHHGKLEFGSPVVPMTLEAQIVHQADDASAKATDFLDALDDGELWADGGEFSKRSWQLGRQVWRRGHEWD